MIKTGDELICIKDFIFNGEKYDTLLFKTGNVYFVENIKSWGNHKNSIVSKYRYFIIGETGSSWIFEENELPFLITLNDYFITKSLWREQQIDNILE